VTTALADNPLLIAANDYWQRTVVFLKRVPLIYWRNLLLFLAAFWICNSVGGLFWWLVPASTPLQPARLAVPVKEEVTVSRADIDISVLQELKLFGDGGTAPVLDVAESQLAPALDGLEEGAATTRLSLQLNGIISSTDPQSARAIIADGNDQQLYRIGEEIAKAQGVKLAKVLEERVILDNNGSYESLWLYSEADFKQSQNNRNRYTVPRTGGRDPNDTLAQAPSQKKTISKSDMPQSVSDVVRFSVHRENGEMVGYKLRPGRDRKLFEEVGLQSGDIVTSVNGREMTDPKQLREVYQELKAATEANLVVRRGDEDLQITIRVDNSGG